MYPRVLDCFASWVDLQELVKDAAQLGKAENPSMRDSLTALGFGIVGTDVGSVWKKHTAAKDSLRIAAILASLLSRGHDDAVLSLIFTHRRKWSPGKASARYKSSGKFFRGPPKPTELFPFTAKVVLINATLAPVKVGASSLMDIFADYCPAAVGMHPRSGISGFVSLSSLSSLEQFIASVDGQSCEEYGGNWTVVSIFDPTLTPARTAEELDQFHQPKLEEKILEEGRLRQMKKSAQSSEHQSP
ncbi:hypothetical protein NLG97_g4986 [Lecanicillium saksenae]|uniref:Uncharacterized protein n=1 Tax=Lecanicillium saksenae TaxID=468837 RepID=A0ACC1QTX1_9HYPO|nr:hypothetical protein NLG97_g4986 [Lecanicillium saksenae]